MKNPAAAITMAADRTALAVAATPVIRTAIHLFSFFLVNGYVALTRPRLGALYCCADGRAERPNGVSGRHLSRSLGPAALDLACRNSERT